MRLGAPKPPKKCTRLLSLMLLLAKGTHAWVPPHPDSEEPFEPVHEMRRRLGLSYSYTPNFINEELCRHLTEAECKDVDHSLQDHARRQRRITQQAQEDKKEFSDHIQDNDYSSLLNQLNYPAQTSTRSSSSKQEPVTQPMLRRNPSMVEPDEPIIEVLILLMRFQDHKDRVLPTKEDYSELWNKKIARWFSLNSDSNYRFRATVTDWMDTDGTEEAYAAGVSGLQYSLQESIWPLLNQLNEDPTWSWSKFDRDGDGKLDAVVILHSGYPAEVGGRDCSNQRPAQDRIWSHAFASSQTWTTIGILGSADYSYNLQQYQQLQQTLQEMEALQQQQQQQQQQQMGPQGLAPMEEDQAVELVEPIYSLHGYLFASGLSTTCGAQVAKMGVMLHEFLHTLGLDDVYDYGTDSNGKGIGIWDIMGYPYGPANDEDYPGHLSAYSKLSLGWITPTEWFPEQGTRDLSLAPAEISNHAIKIHLTNGTTIFDITQPQAIPTPKLMPQYQNKDAYYEEYLLLEHRESLEYDRDLNDRTGLIIYHVDESVPRMNSRGYPGQDGWPQNGRHYRVSVLGADGLYDLERGVNKGDRGDTWRPGSVLGPGTARAGESTKRGFDNGEVTYPNTDSYQYGAVKETGIHIEVLSESEDLLKVRISWRNVVSGDFEVMPMSTRSSTSNVTDCINLWTWVDLEVQDEQGDDVKQSVHCDDVAKEPDSYCSLQDVSCGLEVREICRKECPASDCYV